MEVASAIGIPPQAESETPGVSTETNPQRTQQFTECLLVTEQYGKYCPNLNLIDMPGLFQAGGTGKESKDRETVERMAKK